MYRFANYGEEEKSELQVHFLFVPYFLMLAQGMLVIVLVVSTRLRVQAIDRTYALQTLQSHSHKLACDVLEKFVWIVTTFEKTISVIG
jgi:hypothetical protein